MAYGTINADLMTTSDGVSSSGLYGFKNRIINGAMVIDQRNAGASVTNTTSNVFITDRWNIYGTQASKFTAQQNAGSVTPPSGFINYLGITSSSAYSILSSDYFYLNQNIEGLNCTDLSWGTANAKTVTLSFWVRSSLTGTFGGSLANSAYNRSYPFTYTISSANTWEQKTITIAGDTSGTWLTTNGVGIQILLGLGVGSSQSGTAGAWTGAGTISATGATSVVGTSGATFYITGVQLEKGSTATSFDYRPYGTELQLCQRYYELVGVGSQGVVNNSSQVYFASKFSVTKRASPSVTVSASMGFQVCQVAGYTTSSASYSSLNSVDTTAIVVIVNGWSGLSTTAQYSGFLTTSNAIQASSEL